MPGLGKLQRRHTAQHRHQPIERLRQDTRKSLWYAFDTLANTDTKLAHRSQLKVVTSTIGVPLGFDKSEEILNADASTPDLAYEEYICIVEREIFDKINSSTMDTMNLSDNDLEEIHRSCWLLYLQLRKEPKGSRENLNRVFPETVSYSLWRVFNFLAEEDDTGMPIRPLQLHQEEASHVLNEFVESTGQVTLLSQIDEQLNGFIQPMSFQQFEMLFQNKFAKNLGESSLKSATDSLFQKYIGDTLMKGMVCKRGRQVKSWNDRWMVLNSKELTYYTTLEQKEMKGSITLDKSCSVEMMADKSGTKPNRFVLKTQNKPYEMSASDTKTRSDWMSALQRAIDKSEDKNFHFHRNELLLRRQRRNEKRRQKEEEERKKQEEEENIKRMQEEFNERLRLEELKQEKLKKDLAEVGLSKEELAEKLRQEEALRREEQQRLKELERLLEEERQAKRDEEIVRGLQARLLLEEEEKREELEKLRQEQEELLQNERERREGLEVSQKEQSQRLQEAQEMLTQLEQQRMAAEQKLQAASDKLQEAERERQNMELKMEKEKQQAEYKAKLWKTPTVGLAKPLPVKIEPHITHRGKGAFCDADFSKHSVDHGEDQTKSDLSNTDANFTKSVDNNTVLDKPETELSTEDGENITANNNKVLNETESTNVDLHVENNADCNGSEDKFAVCNENQQDDVVSV